MNPDEFRSARKVLRLSEEQLAKTLEISPHDVTEIENGRKRVPKATARELEWRLADARRDAVMAASGLAECPVAVEFEKQVDGLSGDEGLKVLEEFAAHVEYCVICKAREKYATRHLAPVSQIPHPLWARAFDWMTCAPDRLPASIRPPEGSSGEARRFVLSIAFYVYAVCIAFALLIAIFGLIAHGSASSWWQSPLLAATILPFAYVAGSLLAATVVDLTRPIANRFWGCVIRGGLILPAFVGIFGPSVGIVQTRTAMFGQWPIILLTLGAIGSFGGSLLWVVHWVRGKLPASMA